MNLVSTSLLIVTITMVYKYRWHTLHRVICEGWINRNTVSKDGFQSIIAQYLKSRAYYFIFTVWSILCTITVQNTLCVQCAVHGACSSIEKIPLRAGSPRLTLALSTNQVAIPALSCTTVRQHQPMVLSTIIYHPCYRSFLQFLEPIQQCEQRAMAMAWSLLLYFSSEFNEN